MMPAMLIAGGVLAVVTIAFVLRPRVATKNIGGDADEESPDLIAEQDEADFAAAAGDLRARRSAVTVSNCDEIPLPPDINWEEPSCQFRPPPTSPSDLCRRIGSALPETERGKHFVLIRHEVYDSIVAHLNTNLTVELGGLLAGEPYYVATRDAYCILITHAFAADGGKETSISFEYTPEAWEALTPKLQAMPEGSVVVGSYHSHPGLGVFLSSTDLNTQADVFNQDWQIALVIDPVKNDTGFFISAKGTKADYFVLDDSPLPA